MVGGRHHGNPLMCRGVYAPITSRCYGQRGIYGITSAMATGQKRNDTKAQGCSTATEDGGIPGYNAQCRGMG